MRSLIGPGKKDMYEKEKRKEMMNASVPELPFLLRTYWAISSIRHCCQKHNRVGLGGVENGNWRVKIVSVYGDFEFDSLRCFEQWRRKWRTRES
jgi:hypothetical protein